jgi:vacuolar-type H+-ATPase subunit I/STV1
MTLVAALAALGALPAAAATYKWVDEKGVVHYTDKIPPEQVPKGNVQLDKQGVTIKRTEPAPSAEERRAKADREAREQQLARERELVERRDKALLSTYTMESEIDLARRRALSTIDQQIESSAAYTVQLNKRKADLEAKKAAVKGQPVPPVLEREISNLDAELARQADLVAAKQKEVVLVNVRYDADLKRWRELRAATEAQMNAAAIKAAAEAKGKDTAKPQK